MICIRSFLNHDKHISQHLYRAFTTLQYLTRMVQRNLLKVTEMRQNLISSKLTFGLITGMGHKGLS